jgi:hypothetical protein
MKKAAALAGALSPRTIATKPLTDNETWDVIHSLSPHVSPLRLLLL